MDQEKINDNITQNSLPISVMFQLNYRNMDCVVSEYCNDSTKNNVQTNKKLNFSDSGRLI